MTVEQICKLTKRNLTGFTLIESLVTLTILALVALGIYGMFNLAFKGIGSARAKIVAAELAHEKMEIIRNMAYDKIGTELGWPHGEIPSSETINKQGINYTIKIKPTYLDDPFDGLAPEDKTPNDYKRIDIEVWWDKYPCRNPVVLSSFFSPKGLETAENTGSLRIKVFDSQGKPVSQASVKIENTDLHIEIEEQTDGDGNLLLLSLPEDVEAYHIEATKQGYSKDYTLRPSEKYPNPVKPDATVKVNEVTEISFSIDQVSSLKIFTVDKDCQTIPNITFNLQGAKKINKDPVVYKYSEDLTTNSQGEILITDLEWDSYSLKIESAESVLAGANSILPFDLLPAISQNFYLVIEKENNGSLRVTVKDSGSLLPLSGAKINLKKEGFEKIQYSGKGYLKQIDWSGGSGQEDLINSNQYFSDDGNINVLRNPGNVYLAGGPTREDFSEDFKTTTYKDEGETTAFWDTDKGEVRLPWDEEEEYQDQAQVRSKKINSVFYTITKATLGATYLLNGQTIDYFLSADGGDHFESVIPGVEHSFSYQGNDLQWKAILKTGDDQITPVIQSLIVSYHYTKDYAKSGSLISSSFDTKTASDFSAIIWQPKTQDSKCGQNCLKFQIATNNDKATWNFFGPDGTSSSYYTQSDSSINQIHKDNQYLRYQAFLSTEDLLVSPIFSEIAITYTSKCSTPGQAFFSGLEKDDYTLTVSLEGYQDFQDTIEITGENSIEILLSP